MAREYGSKTHQTEDFSSQSLKAAICRMAQLVASIPDKARPVAPPSLTSQYPYLFSFLPFFRPSMGYFVIHLYLEYP